jgi:glycosyltransferase involved in cell wall biosynthesis
LELFSGRAQAHARVALKVDPPVLAVVGNLVKEKRHDLILESLAEVAGATLLIVGRGPEETRLRQLSRSLGIAQRVRFLGFRPQAELPLVYSAADALLLASDREGWPNVLLESMACGTPVIARRVGGVPEVVAAPEAGRLVDEATPQALATAIRELLADPPSRAATRAYAERFSWDDTTEGQLELFREVIEKHRKRHGT